MKVSSALQLLCLAAIWGSSFLFMRMGVDVLSPAVLIAARVGFAALFLFSASLWLKRQTNLLENWKHFLILGFFNSALPFLLFAWSVQTLSASMLSILNATSPLWGMLVGVAIRQNALTVKSTIGLFVGIAGVSLLVGFDKITLQADAPLAILAALGAAFCYAIASTYTRIRTAKAVSSFDNAHGSMWAASLLILPLLFTSPAPPVPDLKIIIAVIMLGVVCTGIAYVLYFKLVEDIGAPSALTVTFLVPVFGVAWGHLFLDEVIGWHTVSGMVLVVTGTALVTGFSVKNLIRARRSDSA